MSLDVSVIIPAYNEEKLIEKTLVSLKKQEYKPLELIVVDNNSTDRTAEIARDCGARVLTYNSKQNPSAARNVGALHCQGAIIAFLDADSCLSSNALGNSVKAIEQGYAGGTCKLLPPEDKFLARAQTAILNNWARYIGAQYTPFIYTSRKNYFASGGWNEQKELGDELFFQRRLRELGKLKFDLESYVTTSARRYRQKGYIKTTFLGVLGYCGVDMRWGSVRE